jgi:hypothetical protein
MVFMAERLFLDAFDADRQSRNPIHARAVPDNDRLAPGNAGFLGLLSNPPVDQRRTHEATGDQTVPRTIDRVVNPVLALCIVGPQNGIHARTS